MEENHGEKEVFGREKKKLGVGRAFYFLSFRTVNLLHYYDLCAIIIVSVAILYCFNGEGNVSSSYLKKEELEMLSLERKYYVLLNGRTENVVASWASWNEMKIVGEIVEIPEGGQALLLDVHYNRDLKIKPKAVLPRMGQLVLYNREKKIGTVKAYTREGDYAIEPEIADR